MPISRYTRNSIVAGGARYGTSVAGVVIYNAVQTNQIAYKRIVTRDGMRLDTLAAQEYGDSSLWWVIAAASKIGWALQIPPDTVLTIPTDISQVSVLVG